MDKFDLNALYGLIESKSHSHFSFVFMHQVFSLHTPLDSQFDKKKLILQICTFGVCHKMIMVEISVQRKTLHNSMNLAETK